MSRRLPGVVDPTTRKVAKRSHHLNNTVLVTKGSGSNGIDTVYQLCNTSAFPIAGGAATGRGAASELFVSPAGVQTTSNLSPQATVTATPEPATVCSIGGALAFFGLKPRARPNLPA